MSLFNRWNAFNITKENGNNHHWVVLANYHYTRIGEVLAFL